MKNTVKEVGTRTSLPRVADLERSVEWTSLTNDIDDLVKLRRPDRLAVIRRGKRDAQIERHFYQRVSMPEMQRAYTVHFEDDHDTPLRRDYEPVNSRWSWKPRTDFEREYFYKDYKDYYGGDPGKCLEPVSHGSAPRDRDYMQETRRSSGSPVRKVVRGSSARYPERLEKEHFSDSRERLHEIFEHNRYLRRQFFADIPRNAQQNCNGLTGNVGRNSQEVPKRCAGFGSTETLTSQSNQSSVSSINDRKSRAQATRTPEEEEEEMDTLTEFARRNLSRVINRRNGGRARRDGRLVVNILPGSEIRRADVRNVPSIKPDEASNERSTGSSIVEEVRFRDAASERGMHDKSCQCRIEEDGINLNAWCRERNLPEYIFGGTSKNDFETRQESQDSLNGSGHGHIDEMKNRTRKDKFERNQFFQNEICSRRIRNCRGRSDSVSANIGETSVLRNDDGTYWDLCRSLPNLAILKRNLDTPLYVARAVNVPEGLESLGSSDCHELETRAIRLSRADLERCREQQSEQCEEIVDQTRSINHRQSTSKSTTDVLVSPNCLTPRRKVKAARIPPPLDLSMVNEQCERMEANERKCLSDYTVDVAILHSHEDHMKDLLTAVANKRDNTLQIADKSPRNDEDSYGKDPDRKRRKSSELLYKSCGDLPDDLQSPQLVNNCKNSTSDLRGADSTTIGILPIDPDARRRDRATSSPLFDQMNSIGGPHIGGSALPSTVYGPIPYSQ